MANLVIKQNNTKVKSYGLRNNKITSPSLKIGNQYAMMSLNEAETKLPPRMKIGSYWMWEQSTLGPFTVAVTGGSGSGSYRPYEIVNVRYEPSDSMVGFVRWETNLPSVPSSGNFNFEMVGHDVSLIAVEEQKYFNLKSNHTINYHNPPSTTSPNFGWWEEGAILDVSVSGGNGNSFVRYDTDITFIELNENTGRCKFAMPARNVVLTAIFEDRRRKLYVVNGAVDIGGGHYYNDVKRNAGEVVNITCETHISDDEIFSGWTGYTVNDPMSKRTSLVMPDRDITVTANKTELIGDVVFTIKAKKHTWSDNSVTIGVNTLQNIGSIVYHKNKVISGKEVQILYINDSIRREDGVEQTRWGFRISATHLHSNTPFTVKVNGRTYVYNTEEEYTDKNTLETQSYAGFEDGKEYLISITFS